MRRVPCGEVAALAAELERPAVGLGAEEGLDAGHVVPLRPHPTQPGHHDIVIKYNYFPN